MTKLCTVTGCTYPGGECSGECYHPDERRMDIIGQNGPTGDHYDMVNHPPHYTQGGIECTRTWDWEYGAMSKQREAFDALEGIHPGNMSKHTPGPWRVVDGFYPSVKEIKGPSFTITAVMWATDLTQKDYQNRHYDLRLIAAAPDLLEALESSLEEMKDDWITLDGEFGPFMQEFGDIESAIKEEHASTKTIRMAIAAIAKAKGEA